MTDPTDRSIYPHWAQDHVRFQDLDRLGHVNNIAFCVYSETGRVKFAEDLCPGSTDGSKDQSNSVVRVASTGAGA